MLYKVYFSSRLQFLTDLLTYLARLKKTSAKLSRLEILLNARTGWVNRYGTVQLLSLLIHRLLKASFLGCSSKELGFWSSTNFEKSVAIINN